VFLLCDRQELVVQVPKQVLMECIRFVRGSERVRRGLQFTERTSAANHQVPNSSNGHMRPAGPPQAVDALLRAEL
jgi:hypothetical protein